MATALEITDLFVLSDILQMELYLNTKGGISGLTNRSTEIPDLGLKINITPEVVSSKVSWVIHKGKAEPIIALLVKVHGDLYLMAGNDKSRDKVVVTVIDAARLPFNLGGYFEAHPGSDMKTLVGTLAPGKVAEFDRVEYGTTWNQLLQAKAA